MKKNIFFLPIILFAMSLVSVQAARAIDNKAEGKRLCQLGKYEEAKPFLERAIRQNSRSGALWYLAIVKQHLYDFDGAVEALESYLPALSSEKWLNRADSLMTTIKIGQRAFNHCQDVVIIDSLQVGKDDFFAYYRLGAESGRILKDEGEPYFENLAGDHQIFSTGSGFEERHKFQGQWDERHPVGGFGSEQFNYIDPFLRSDGETLFFACDSTPGMGGFDIYRTTFNAEANAYYEPERLDMPFNSPYDDYMMAIDETHQVGWWATNRNAGKDSVTIYLFLLDDETSYLDEPIVSRARIDNIAETWREKGGYASLIEQLKEAPQEMVVEKRLHIVINDDKIYTSEEQFRNSDALQAYQKSVLTQQKIAEQESDLASLRSEYAGASASDRRTLGQKIAHLEEALFSLYRQRRDAELRYRRLEQ